MDLEFVRSHFPALSEDWALFDNAGGSVPVAGVIDEIADYMRRYGVQLGASYGLSVQAGERIAAGHRAMEKWLGAGSGEVVIGASTTANVQHLARALRPLWKEGDEIVVTDLDHESHVGPWRALEASGMVVREWGLRPETASLDIEDLLPLLGDRTRLVAMTHCSNLVGRIHDVAAVAKIVHEAGALLSVDGVAFAPHRRVDVEALGVDFYLVSAYKIYGPHQGILWGRHDLLRAARGQSHFFIGEEEVPYKFQPGGANHELAASLTALPAYFESLDRRHFPGSDPAVRLSTRTFARVFGKIAEHEEALAEPLLEFLRQKKKVRILGPAVADRRIRVPTISFVVEDRRSSEIPPLLDGEKIAVRWGDFYARRAVSALGLEDRDGVVRVSMVHYNTPAEVDRLVRALDRIL